MSEQAAIVFTAKAVERILREGGTSSWRLDPSRARQCVYAVCTRNAYADWVEGPEPHHLAFLIGKVKDVVPAPAHEGRYLIRFSEFARLHIPEYWKGDRNPVRYVTIEELGIPDPSSLKWVPMPEPSKQVAEAGSLRALTLSEAKKELAIRFDVPPDAVEITIRV